MLRVAGRVLERDDRAEAEAEHDRALDPDRVAEILDVVRPALDAPFGRRAPVAPAGAAQSV